MDNLACIIWEIVFECDYLMSALLSLSEVLEHRPVMISIVFLTSCYTRTSSVLVDIADFDQAEQLCRLAEPTMFKLDIELLTTMMGLTIGGRADRGRR